MNATLAFIHFAPSCSGPNLLRVVTCPDTDLFDRVFLAGHLSDLGYRLNVVVQLHLKAFRKRQVGLWPDWKAKVIRQLLPMSIAHARVAKTLDEWDEWLKLLDATLDFLRYLANTCYKCNTSYAWFHRIQLSYAWYTAHGPYHTQFNSHLMLTMPGVLSCDWVP